MDVIGDLHHDDGERHGEPGHARKEGDRAQQGEGTCTSGKCITRSDKERRHVVLVEGHQTDS